ncbi:hypothetical protein D3C77_48930 [compost metagenome]
MDLKEAVRRYEAGETAGKLARLYGSAPSTLCRHLKAAGVAMRAKGTTRRVFDDEKLQRLLEMRAAGDKLEYCAAVLGVSVSACAVQMRVHKNRALDQHHAVLVELCEQLRKGLDACQAALKLDNLDRTTRKKYTASVLRFEAQIAALQSVT